MAISRPCISRRTRSPVRRRAPTTLDNSPVSQADLHPVVPSAATRRVVWLSCAALCVPLCAPMLAGRIFVYDDLGAQNLPIRHLYREALRAGDSILWSPALFSGVYLFGEGQTGMAHPFHWVLYRVLPLEIGINIELLGSYIFALEGMRRLLRGRTSESAAVFGAMLFAFCGFNLLHLSQMNVVAVGAHLP